MVFAVTLIMVLVQAFGALATITMVGKPRQPTTGGVAVGTVVVTSLFIVGTLYLASA